MKNTFLRFAATAAIAGGMVLAAQEMGTQQQPAPPAAQRLHNRRARLAQYLGLSPAQIAQAKSQLQGARQASQPLRQQLQQTRAAMFDAIRANDPVKIEQISAQEGNLRGQMKAIHNEALARIYASLTPEQRAKADQIPSHIQQMRQRRMQNRQNANNG